MYIMYIIYTLFILHIIHTLYIIFDILYIFILYKIFILFINYILYILYSIYTYIYTHTIFFHENCISLKVYTLVNSSITPIPVIQNSIKHTSDEILIQY